VYSLANHPTAWPLSTQTLTNRDYDPSRARLVPGLPVGMSAVAFASKFMSAMAYLPFVSDLITTRRASSRAIRQISISNLGKQLSDCSQCDETFDSLPESFHIFSESATGSEGKRMNKKLVVIDSDVFSNPVLAMRAR